MYKTAFVLIFIILNSLVLGNYSCEVQCVSCLHEMNGTMNLSTCSITLIVYCFLIYILLWAMQKIILAIFKRAIPKSIDSFPKAPFFICDLKTIWWAEISPCVFQIHFPLIIFGLWQYGGFSRRKHKAHDLL